MLDNGHVYPVDARLSAYRDEARWVLIIEVLGYWESFMAAQEEIRNRIPKDLPCILLLDEWFHPDLTGGEKPSECETFQMIAEVLEIGDLEYYRPTTTSNNHWTNRPEGGTI